MKIIKKLFLVALSAGLLSVPSQLEKVEALTVNANTYVYYEKPSSWDAAYVQLLIGHGSWSEGYTMTNIPGTDIYYVKMIKWDGYTQYGFMNTNEAKWGGEGSAPKDRIQWGVNKTNICYADGLPLDKAYNIFGGSDTDPWGFPTKGTSHSSLNFKISTDSTVGGTASIKGNELTSATTVTSKSDTSVSILKFTDATLTATAEEGYEFVGWYDAEIGGNLISTDAEHTIKDVYESKTYYARFKTDGTDEVNNLFNEYYNNGIYTRNTTINLTQATMNELITCFHAGNILKSRTTEFIGNELWMTNEAGTYSYYGTSGSNMTGGRVAKVGETVSTVVKSGVGGMEGYYTTMHDIKDNTSKWDKIGNVFSCSDANVIKQFLDFTAPCFLGLDEAHKNYFTLSHVEVEKTSEGLELRLVCSNVENGKFDSNTNNVLSVAKITYEA